jgi:hypothetical protein
MAIIQALLATLAHSTGKVANLAFAWATTMLFGKVPDDRQVVLSAICLISCVWLIAVIGVAFPVAATFLLAWMATKFLNPHLMWLIMIALTFLAPLVSGILALFLDSSQSRPHGFGLVSTVLRGYPLTIGLAITLVTLIVIAPCIKAGDMIKRWESSHVPVQIMPECYFAVVDEVRQALRKRGFAYEDAKSSLAMRLPLKILMLLSGSTFRSFVSDNLQTLKLENGEVAIYPADILIRAPKDIAGAIQATIVESLAFGQANFTWTEEAEHFENLLKEIYRNYRSGKLSFDDAIFAVEGITKGIEATHLDFKEWQTLFADKAILEREIYKRAATPTRWRKSA